MFLMRLFVPALLLAAGCANVAGSGLNQAKKLPPCPASPNCVCSDAIDEQHAIRPLAIAGDPEAAWAALIQYIESAPRFDISVREADYLKAEARTALLRFVDDVEFQLRPDDGQIAMRSASRVGYSDMGTNRRRLESIRTALSDAGVVEPAD